MGDFLVNLWESVFTAGATPTLLIATNVTFGALQILLGALLFATYSIHFVILSFLCGGLWFSINWFARELQDAQAKEAETDRLRKKKRSESDWKSKGEVADSADDEGEDTEVEGAGLKESTASLEYEPTEETEKIRQGILEAVKVTGTVQPSGASSGLQASAGAESARQRRADDADRSGEISSTDSEWEKVDGSR